MTKHPFSLLCLSFLMLLMCEGPARGTPVDFNRYPAPLSPVTCRPLDFESSSKARNSKEMIQSANPSMVRPNFGGKYLLVEVPYMMGREWLIAECETGKFLKGGLSGDAEFKPDSFALRLKTKDQIEWNLWTGTTFISLEVNDSGSAQSINDRYAKVFDRYSSPAPIPICAPLDFNSYFRAQNARSQILKNVQDLKTPNFASHALLIKVELLFETIWLIADCKTGRFFPEFLEGDLTFRPSSRLILLTHGSKPPELQVWAENTWVRKPDPLRTSGDQVENSIQGPPARTLGQALPNPEHHSKVLFSDLRCTADECGVQIETGQPEKKRIPLLKRDLAPLRALLETWGRPSGQFSVIDEGECTLERSLCLLKLKTPAEIGN